LHAKRFIRKREVVPFFCVTAYITAVGMLAARVRDVIEPRFDRLGSTQSRLAESRRQLATGLHRISSGVEFIQSSLALIDLPVTLRGAGDDRFVQLDNAHAGLGRLHDSLGLDVMLPTFGDLSRSELSMAWVDPVA